MNAHKNLKALKKINFPGLFHLIFPLKSRRWLLFRLGLNLLKSPGMALCYDRSIYIQTIRDICSNGFLKQLDRFINITKPELQVFNQENRDIIVFSETDLPLVSIIIPVYNQWHLTHSCLMAIYKNTSDIPYEVIIADDNSDNQSTEIIKYVKNINFIRNKINLGFLLNCNSAAKQARGKYLVILNNDTNVQKGWLKYLVDLAESNKKAGIVGSKLIFEDGKLQEAGGVIWKDGSVMNYGRRASPNKPEYNYVKEVDYISGACILVRRKLWEMTNGFDERYVPAYYEDTDLAFEMRKLGYLVLYQPKSVVVHFEGESHGTDINEGLKIYQTKNQNKFYMKWKKILEEEHFESGKNVFLARDRGYKSRKTMLVLDDHNQHIEYDRRSSHTHNYLKIFLGLGLKVIYYDESCYKKDYYIDQLQQLGIEVIYGHRPWQNACDWIKQNGKYVDYIYLNQPYTAFKYVDLLKRESNGKIFYFGFDLLDLREQRSYEVGKKNKLIRSAKNWGKIEQKVLKKADIIHVKSRYAEELLARFYPGKTVRNIPVYFYENISTNKLASFEERNDLLCLGSFNYENNQDGIRWFAQQIFPMIQKRIPNVKLFIVGSNPPPLISDLACEKIIIKEYITVKELEMIYNNCRVAVAPFRYGAQVEVEIIEAMYFMVPVVTTPISVEKLTNINDSLLIGKTEQEFSDQVVKLYNDKLIWTTLQKRSVNYIRDNYSLEVAKEVIKLDI